jgi:hypothetical protein
VGNGFYSPGFWVCLAAHARAKGIKYEDIRFCAESRRGYSEAIKLPFALNKVDIYEYQRYNEGRHYNGLVLLESEESTDSATHAVNSCIRNWCAGLEVGAFVRNLCEVVGDLHDNVWSHGKSTGFSMAPKWRKPRTENDYCFEFGLADCGIGVKTREIVYRRNE